MFKQTLGISTIKLMAIVAIIGILVIVGIAAMIFLQGNQDQSNKVTETDLKDSTPATYQTNDDIDSAIKELESLDINEAIDAPLEDIDQSAEKF